MARWWAGVADISATDATTEFTYNRVVLIEAHLPRIIVRSRLPNSLHCAVGPPRLKEYGCHMGAGRRANCIKT